METPSKTIRRVVEICDGLASEGYVIYERSYNGTISKVKLEHSRSYNKIEIQYEGIEIKLYKNGIWRKTEVISLAADGGEA